MRNLKKVWDSQYESSENATVLKDKNFFNLEVNKILEEVLNEIEYRSLGEVRLLELGSGTGYLASVIDKELRRQKKKFSYTGVDFSEVACEQATNRHLLTSQFIPKEYSEFLQNDKNEYDIIITQRSIMAIMDIDSQKSLLKSLRDHLSKTGLGIYSECTKQSFKKLNNLREKVGISESIEKVWHSHYLDANTLAEIYSSVSTIDFSSTYWFVTRVIYPFFEEPKHNTPLHEFAASVDQTGTYGLVKLFLVRK